MENIIEKNREWLNDIEYFIRPNSHVIGIKIIKKGEIIPDIKRIEYPLTICQFTTLCRTAKRTEEPFIVKKDDICCSFAHTVMGFDKSEDITSGERDVGIHFETYDGFKKAYDDLPKLEENTIECIIGGPLYSFNYKPDIILFSITPGQTNRFTDGYVWSQGGYLEIKFSGMCGICSNTIIKAYNEKSAILGFPCFGGRRAGIYQDNELAAAIHVDFLDTWLEGLEKTEATGHTFPNTFDLNKNTEGLPHYKIINWPDEIVPAMSTAVGNKEE